MSMRYLWIQLMNKTSIISFCFCSFMIIVVVIRTRLLIFQVKFYIFGIPLVVKWRKTSLVELYGFLRTLIRYQSKLLFIISSYYSSRRLRPSRNRIFHVWKTRLSETQVYYVLEKTVLKKNIWKETYVIKINENASKCNFVCTKKKNYSLYSVSWYIHSYDITKPLQHKNSIMLCRFWVD